MHSLIRKVLIILSSLSYFVSTDAVEVSYDGRALKIDGERRIIIFGSIHYPRSTPKMWPSLIRKAKEGGLNAIDTYVFWNFHEPMYRQYDFSGNRDLIEFLKVIQDEGMYALLRIGPYVTAEWNYGGFPVWLHNMPNVTFRTKNDMYMNEVKKFTTLIVDMVKREKLFAAQGGPVILAQIENEYGGMRKHYGDDGIFYINWCANLAESLNIGVPWIMCEDREAPEPMINTCNGYYGDRFYPRKPNMPKIWSENWTGWVKKWGDKDSRRPVEETAFAVARFFQFGGTSENYYMYHGGTNFGRTAGGPYVTTSYDFDAPLDEYGNLNQPIWGHLKELHFLLRSMEKTLTYGVATKIDYGNMVAATMFTHNGTRACFLGNANDTNDMTINFEGSNYTIPAWSVTILPDCRTEVYNTAQVNTQTSIMVKKTGGFSAEPGSEDLEWTWRPEHIEYHKRSRKGVTFANQLLEQKSVTNDTTDYLWYLTSVEVEKNDPIWGEEVTLQVHTRGHVLHVFLNEEHIGTQFGRNLSDLSFTFEQIVKMREGNNSISLLSATVGLEDYGPFYEKRANGVVGPVQLIAPNSEVKNLSTNEWAYKIGLNGLDKGFYKNIKHHHRKWLQKNIPFNRMFVWFKTSFKTPLGEDPVALDLFGMGKGIAWVNKHNIGRYWPSFIADVNGCNPSCDYRGRHNDKKCMKNCGVPSQRWYHVPRSFLHDEGDNTLILFEEFGGNPSNVKVQTVTIGKACGHVLEGNKLELSCQGGQVISEIRFGSFGNPSGVCGSFERGNCDCPETLSIIEKLCFGKMSCLIDVSEKTFGACGCNNMKKRLAVEVIC